MSQGLTSRVRSPNGQHQRSSNFNARNRLHGIVVSLKIMPYEYTYDIRCVFCCKDSWRRFVRVHVSRLTRCGQITRIHDQSLPPSVLLAGFCTMRANDPLPRIYVWYFVFFWAHKHWPPHELASTYPPLIPKVHIPDSHPPPPPSIWPVSAATPPRICLLLL